jgi:hypothetical protein
MAAVAGRSNRRHQPNHPPWEAGHRLVSSTQMAASPTTTAQTAARSAAPLLAGRALTAPVVLIVPKALATRVVAKVPAGDLAVPARLVTHAVVVTAVATDTLELAAKVDTGQAGGRRIRNAEMVCASGVFSAQQELRQRVGDPPFVLLR